MIAVIIYFYHEAHNHGYLINPNFKILVSSNTNGMEAWAAKNFKANYF